MKKTLKIIYIIIFITICTTPLILMPFIKNNQEIEKKQLSEFPKLFENNKINLNFSTNIENWFNERFPFRSELLSLSNYINAENLHAPSSNVIVGKDEYLFYTVEKEDYMNTNALTNSRINSIAITMSLIEEEIKNKNGNFTFVIMPNKSTIYSEYMPDNYKKSNINNLTRIQEKLKEYNVNYVDMKNILIENKDKDLYHKRDSHWNYKGAVIGYNALMESLDKEHKTYDNLKLTKEKTWRGDLDKLLYPTGGFMDYQYNYEFDYNNFRIVYPMGLNNTKEAVENFMSDKEDNDSYFISSNKNTSDNKKLFIARDSYARALIPFLMDNYKEATFKRSQNPDINSIEKNTDMIYEIAERNTKDIIKTAPFMYAPIRENEKIDTPTKEITSDYKIENYGIKLYGEFDEEINDRIYVQLKNENEIKTYEAFPIHEEEYEDKTKNGYSLYINTKDLKSKEYEITVIINKKRYKAKKLTIN